MKKNRAFTEIHVDKLSLVQSGAVEEDYILIKNQEGVVEEEANESSKVQGEEASSSKEAPEAAVEGEVVPKVAAVSLPTHEALIAEMKLAIAEAGKQITEKAPTLDISDKEQLREFKSLVWAVDDICWNLQSFTDVMALTKSAVELADEGKGKESFEKVAKAITVFGEVVLSKQEVDSEDKGDHPIGDRVKTKAFDSAGMEKLINGVMLIQESLMGVDAESLRAALNAMLGGAEDTPEADAEKEKAKAEEAEKLKALKEEIAKGQKIISKLRSEKESRSASIQSPKGLDAEVSPKHKTDKDKKVVWGDDLAPKI